MSAFSTPLGIERKHGEVDLSLASDGQNRAQAVFAGDFPEDTAGPTPVGPCGSGAEREAATGACSTTQANQPARSSPSACHSRHEINVGPSVAVAGGMDGLGASVDAPDTEFNDETGGIAGANWLDVTHAMLGAIDGPNYV